MDRHRLLLLLAGTLVACVTDDRMLAPSARKPAPQLSADAVASGVLGSYTLHPPSNHVFGMGPTNTGIPLPLGVAVRVTVSGKMKFTLNPEWLICSHGQLPSPLSLESVGPWGFPPAGDFGVHVGEGGATGIQLGQFRSLEPPDGTSDTAGVDLLGGGGFLWVERSGVGETCGDTPAYTVEGDQLVVVRGPGGAAVRIRSLSGSFDVRPRGAGDPSTLPLEVSVVDENGTPIPDQFVTFRLEATEGTAGHLHSGGKPPGGLSGHGVSTGPEGRVTVTYTASEASGPVHLQGSSLGATPDDHTITAGVPGLEALPPSDVYLLVGGGPAFPSHPDNHYGSPPFNTALHGLATFFFERYEVPLEYNDMSLVQGGLFDFHDNWSPPHDEHRLGTNVDLRIRSGDTPFSDRQLDWIRLVWTRYSTQPFERAVNVEADPPHWHLRY